jgi:diguanylate cyclase (GGDEF)-like protein
MTLRSLAIRRKLMLLGTAVSATVVLVCIGAFLAYDAIRLERLAQGHLSVQAGVLAEHAGNAVASGDRQGAWSALQVLDASPGVSAAWIRQLDGRSLAAYQRNGSEPLTLTETAFASGGKTAGHLTVRAPIRRFGETIGFVDIAADTGFIDRDVLEYALGLSLTAALAIAVALLVSLRFQRAIADPVIGLRELARRVVRERNYALRAPAEGGDEFGELTASINELLEHIEQRDAMLEQQVKERTRELVRLNDQLKHQVYHDTLTRLPNRALFDDRLTLALAQAERYRTMLAVMFLDLDEFKNINDTLGHEYGDELLRAVAERLRRAVRSNDTVARLGGDEFTIIISQLESPDDAGQVAASIIRALGEHFDIAGRSLKVTASIGISVYPVDGDTVSVLKRNADAAMYHAKELGRNNYQFFSDELNARARHRLLMLTELEASIRRNDLLSFYHPRLDVVHDRIIAVQASARWRHPQQGLIAATDIARFAAEAGLAGRLDRWLARDAIARCAGWRRRHQRSFTLVLGLSAQSLLDEGIVAYLGGLLSESALEPGAVQIEIDEAVLVKHSARLAGTLRALGTRGWRLAIANFGTGYAAFEHLAELPIDTIKLSQEHTSALPASKQAIAVVKAVMAMAGSLGITVVAEDIDRAEVRDLLVSLGCTAMEGPLFHSPLSAAEFEIALDERGEPAAKPVEAAAS